MVTVPFTPFLNELEGDNDMVMVTGHGGRCCGARHIWGFGGNIERDTNEVKRLIRQKGKGRLYEVILNYTQVRSGRMQPLLDMGFRLVTKFKNSSGGTCFVLHYAATGHKTARVNGKRYKLCNDKPSPWIGRS